MKTWTIARKEQDALSIEAPTLIAAVEQAARDGLLRGAVLDHMDLEGALLTKADLRDATLRYAKLKEAELALADLEQADLTDATLDSVNLLGANLRRATLRRADLELADLVRANLAHADLRYALMKDADLYGADLYGANLECAQLERAHAGHALFINANLTSSALDGADLSGANLNNATLTGASMSTARLDRHALPQANLAPIRDDFFKILNAAPNEVDALEAALTAGNVNGQIYEARCACLIGTIANARGVYFANLAAVDPELEPTPGRPAERWFLAIAPDDLPATHPVVYVTLAWIAEWRAWRSGNSPD